MTSSHPIGYFDLVCKNGPATQKAGFRRPFLAFAIDPAGEELYFRAPKFHSHLELAGKPHLKSGGVVDQLMCHFMLSNACAQPAVIHTASSVALMFMLEWVLGHRATYDVEVGHVGTRVACLEIESREHKGRTWLFEDVRRTIADEVLTRRLRAMDIDLDLHEDDFRWPSALADSCRRVREHLLGSNGS